MFSQRLPQLRPGELKNDVSKGSGDPRRDSSSSMKLSLEQSNKPTNSCRAIHALWNQDVKEVTLRMYRVESSLRMSQGEATSLHERHEDDIHRLRAKVYVLEEKVHLLQNELQSQRHEHHDLTHELRTEMHRTRELMHQMTGDIQGLKHDQVLSMTFFFSY